MKTLNQILKVAKERFDEDFNTAMLRNRSWVALDYMTEKDEYLYIEFSPEGEKVLYNEANKYHDIIKAVIDTIGTWSENVEAWKDSLIEL